MSAAPSETVFRTSLGLTALTSLIAANSAEGAATEADTRATDSPATVVVTGQRPSLEVLPETILDTPQSINVVSGELIGKQGGASLADALKNVPGITLNAGEGGTHGDLVNLRGFSAGDDYFMDGLRDTGLYDRDAFNYEALEIYKGPASTIFGRGSTGGVINQIEKAPQLQPFQNFTATAGTNSEARATADVNAPLAEHAALRLNLMGMRNEVEGRPFTRNQRWGLAPTVGVGIDTATALTLKYLHQTENNLPDYGIPFLFDRPAPVARDTFYGLPADDRFQSRVDVGTLKFHHAFGSVWSVSDTARYGNYYFLSRETAAIYGSGNCFTSTSSAGYFAGAPVCAATASKGEVPVASNNPYFPVIGTPIASVQVLRDRPSGSGTIKIAMNDLDFTARFSTGPLSHAVIFGTEYDDERAELVRFVNQDTLITPVALLAPDPFESFPGTQTDVSQRPSTRTHTVGVYGTDTVGLGPHWDLTAAIRYDSFHAAFDQPVGQAAHFDHTDEIWSPRAALDLQAERAGERVLLLRNILQPVG
ncbi:MAG TPA: TonB-dependent receptor [Steroidobacteraceae bacterium]